MGLLSEYRPSGTVHSIGWHMQGSASNVLRSEFGHLGNIATLRSKPYFVASVGQVCEAKIRKCIGEGITGAVRGMS